MNWDLLNKKIDAYRFGRIQIETVIGILILAAIIIGFFFLLRRYVLPYLGSRKVVRRSRIITYRVEVIVWSAFVVLSLYQLLSDSLYITGVLLLIVILAGLNFWRDFFAGIAFRLENKFQLRDPVKYDNYNGLLHEVNRRNIVIKTDKEELVTIPFRKVSNAVIIKKQAKGKLHSQQLSLSTAGKAAEEVLNQINDWIFQCPWAVNHENTKAKIIGSGMVQVTVYAVDLASIRKIEEYLQQCIRK